MEACCEFSRDYYQVLGVGPCSSAGVIKRAYRKLAMKWHPDRWSNRPWMLGEANRNFQMIQEAYEVLSDEQRKIMYDAGMYCPSEEEEEEDDVADNEGFYDFVQEMTSLVEQTRAEKQEYSLEDLQGMQMEMAQGFDFPQWPAFDAQDNTIFDYPSWPGSIHAGCGGGTLSFGTSGC